MKVLVSGGTGHLGSKIIKNLIRKGHTISLILRDDSKKKIQHDDKVLFIKYSDLFKEISFDNYDAILHCATKYSYEKDRIIDLLDPNLILPMILLKKAVKNKIKYFINIDTLIENDINEYSNSKANLRYWLRKFDNSLNIINIRIDHFYGPQEKSSKFINNIICSLIENKSYIELTEGLQERSFIYIDDVVDAIEIIFENLDPSNFYTEYNIAGSKSYSIKYIVEKIKTLTNNKTTELKWGKLPYRKNECYKSKYDLTKIKSLGWKERTDLIDGLIKTVEFYKK